MIKNTSANTYTNIIVGLFAVSVVVMGLIVFVVAGTQNTGQASQLTASVLPNDWAKGNKGAAVKLVEYSDFQCPACGAYYPLVKQLTEEFGSQVEFTYRHFPLSQIHMNANLAARAAEAAGKQGKFWEMHNMLFENQQVWSGSGDARKIFIEYARSKGLVVSQFEQDIDSKEIKEKIEADYASGVRSGVNGTPTFFLNGVKIENPKNYDEFKAIILKATNTVS